MEHMPSSNDTDVRSAPAGSDLQSCFEAVLALPPAQREAWLNANVASEESRATLRRLLVADERRSFLDTPVDAQIERLAAAEIRPEGLIGRQIGEFRLVRALGRGGMAAVFLGERVGRDFRQCAAVKLLLRGLYSELEQRLFQRERRVLATLEHPNIARLIDGGVTEAGIPYLMMEYVDGVPITEHAREHQLDISRCLKLFVDVCRAVDAAHRRLIVHRDIKPSNILVTRSGEVKLLDFGIAKLLEDEVENATGTVSAFTPDYAAPEQMRGGTITTATDVYGLGVLLHVLLLGEKPGVRGVESGSNRSFALSGKKTPAPDARPVAAKEKKYTNAQMRRLLRGDLDNILRKALAEEPERRYPSAGALADDVERHLDGRPVRAHPPTRRYRAKKFIARHRAGVLGSAVFLVAILAALGIAVWQAKTAKHAMRVAQAERMRAEEVHDFIVSVFREQDPLSRAQMQARSPQQLIGDAVARLDGAVSDSPETHAELVGDLGEIQYNLGDLSRSVVTLERAAAERRTAFGATSPQLAQSLGVLCQARAFAARIDDARAACDEAIAIYRANAQEDSIDAALIKLRLADVISQVQGATQEVFDLLGQAQKTLETKLGPNDQRAVAALVERAEIMQTNDQEGPESEALLHEAIRRLESEYGADNVYLWRPWVALGLMLRDEMRYTESEQAFVRGIALMRGHFGAKHQDLAKNLAWLAILYTDMGRSTDAQRTFNEAEEALPEGDSAERAMVLLRRVGFDLPRDPERAERDVLEAYELRVRLFGENSTAANLALSNWAWILEYLGKLPEAEAANRKALASQQALLGANSSKTWPFLAGLAGFLEVHGEHQDEALSLRRQQLAVIETKYPHSNPTWARAAIELAAVLVSSGTPSALAEAKPLYDDAVVTLRRAESNGGGVCNLALALAERGRYQALMGNRTAARADLSEAQSLWKQQNVWLGQPPPSIERIPRLLRQLDITAAPKPALADRRGGPG
jgi:serine/threonine protein kinase